MSLLHIGGGSGSSVVAPEGVDFDGVSDYLSRSTDLVGNVDSKTFTFSCWVYYSTDDTAKNIYSANGSGLLISMTGADNRIQIQASDTSNSISLINATIPDNSFPKNQWNHLLISIDLTSTSKRYIYVNDVLKTTTWSVYVNNFIGFKGVQKVGFLNNYLKGRLSNVFLSYDYIDLSIEANRRIFITADGKPA